MTLPRTETWSSGWTMGSSANGFRPAALPCGIFLCVLSLHLSLLLLRHPQPAPVPAPQPIQVRVVMIDAPSAPVHQAPPKRTVHPTVARRKPEALPAPSLTRTHSVERRTAVSDTTPVASPSAPSSTAPVGQALVDPKGASSNGIRCHVPRPSYPAHAKWLKQQGKVTLRLHIDATGHLERYDLVESSGVAELDNAAIDAISRSRCEPMLVNNVAVPVSALQTIMFKLAHP